MLIQVFVIVALLLLLLYQYLQKRKLSREIHLQKSKEVNLIQEDVPIINKEMELLSIVATQTDNAIMVMDPEGNIEWLNEGFTKMYEYTFDDFIRERGSNILQTSFNPEIRKRLERCRTTLQPVNYEALNVTVSGKEIWTHTSLNPILDKEGNLIYMATVDSDISRRKGAGDNLLERIELLTSKINKLSQQQEELTRISLLLKETIDHSTQSAHKADVIVNLIKEVSDKVKIMGINASIEAQTAGRHGAGFRVISGEIVRMSDETRGHVKQISEIVDGIKSNSDNLQKERLEIENITDGYAKLVENLRGEVRLIEQVADRLN